MSDTIGFRGTLNDLEADINLLSSVYGVLLTINSVLSVFSRS